MGYVMMPVPEEHVEAVMQFVLREMAKASLQPWDHESLTQLYEEVDEASRSLLAFVARATTEGINLSDVEAAAKIQLTARETVGIVNEVQTLTRESGRPALLSPRVITERLPNGRSTTKRIISMEPEVAELVRAVEQAELQSLPHPLGEPTG
jgi:hypothetical protein